MAEILMDFLDKEFIPAPYIIGRGVLPVKGKAIIGGEPKANKSFVVLNIMLDLVRGRRLFDATYKSGAPVLPVSRAWRVLYLEQELGDQGLLERFKGKEGKPGLTSGIDAKGLDLYIKPRDTAMRLDTAEGQDYIDNEVKSVRPDVLILDPMAKFHVSDENSSQEMGAVLRVCDHLIEDHGCAIILVHHTSKPREDGSRVGGAKLRGSSAIWGDVDTLIDVVRKSNEHHPEPVLELSFTMRRGEPIESLFVQRMRDGAIQWLGEGYQFGQMQTTKSYPRSRYAKL